MAFSCSANLEEAVAQYGPNPYVGLTGFSFGLNGNKLFASDYDNGPYTCEPGYDYYPVDQEDRPSGIAGKCCL
jgi:hypothetical protein